MLTRAKNSASWLWSVLTFPLLVCLCAIAIVVVVVLQRLDSFKKEIVEGEWVPWKGA